MNTKFVLEKPTQPLELLDEAAMLEVTGGGRNVRRSRCRGGITIVFNITIINITQINVGTGNSNVVIINSGGRRSRPIAIA